MSPWIGEFGKTYPMVEIFPRAERTHLYVSSFISVPPRGILRRCSLLFSSQSVSPDRMISRYYFMTRTRLNQTILKPRYSSSLLTA